MAANKYLSNNAGTITEVQAKDSSGGGTDGGKIVALDATGRLALNMMPTSIGPEMMSLPTFESLAANDLVNIFADPADSNIVKARKADASNGRSVHGFVKIVVTAPAAVDVYFEGDMSSLLAKTPGAKQFLSGAIPGAMTETAPTTSTYLVQSVGYATGATTARIQLTDPIVLA